jgi:hypothetical protein
LIGESGVHFLDIRIEEIGGGSGTITTGCASESTLPVRKAEVDPIMLTFFSFKK